MDAVSTLKRACILGTDLLLDTGITKNIFHVRNPALVEAFWRSVGRHNSFECRAPYFISTFMMTLEFLGFTAQELDPFQHDRSLRDKIIVILRKPDDVGRTTAEALSVLLGWFLSAEIFSRDALKKRLQIELAYRPPMLQELCHSLFGRNIEADYSESLKRVGFATLIAFDYQHIGLDNELIKRRDMHFLGGFRQMLCDGYDGYSFARPSDRMIRMAYASKGVAVPAMYSNAGEGLDAEIVHFVVSGHLRSGKAHPVSVFTCEKISAWRGRIERYLVFLMFLRERDEAELYPGVIYQVDQRTGELKDVLDVYAEYSNQLSSFKLGQDWFLR